MTAVHFSITVTSWFSVQRLCLVPSISPASGPFPSPRCGAALLSVFQRNLYLFVPLAISLFLTATLARSQAGSSLQTMPNIKTVQLGDAAVTSISRHTTATSVQLPSPPPPKALKFSPYEYINTHKTSQGELLAAPGSSCDLSTELYTQTHAGRESVRSAYKGNCTFIHVQTPALR